MSAVIRIFVTITLALAMIPAAHAQSEKTILVLDASGSMWGQIDGVNKIVIAKQAIGDLLDTLPEDTQLGLTAYGHREKGQCSDIETLVEPGLNTRDAIRAAVEGINPKGKTPLSDAVLQAAEALKYEEDKATVILLSDGIETCERDPCAVGNALEQAGVDFTAHVIGFDVSADADREQLACLAENTGGRFLAASNATELTEALVEVAETPPPPPASLDAEFVATLGEDGPIINDGLLWTLTPDNADGTTLSDFEIGLLRMAVRPGQYQATVTRPETEDSASLRVNVAADRDNRFVLVLPDPTPKATVEAPSEAPIGSDILVTWTGPGHTSDRINIAKADERPSASITYGYVSKGNPLPVTVPPLPGEYEIRYYHRDGTILATAPLTATPLEFSLNAPETAVASETIVVEWTGPGYQSDRITIAKAEDRGSHSINYAQTRDGSPLKLAMPVEPGEYEIRYVMWLGNTIQARRPITVTDLVATIEAPATGPAGTPIVVNWEGPDNQNDRITIAKVDAPGSHAESYKYTKDGSPTRLILPGVPGEYEVRYLIAQGNNVAASSLVTVTPPEVTLTVPESATIGGVAKIGWTGPDNQNDRITIAEPGSRGNQAESYEYTKRGNPVDLTMPSQSGTYEVRYVLAQGNVILATAPLVVEEETASISAPDTGEAGGTLVVEWTGPDTQNDYIAVAKAGSDHNRYESYTYTKDGSPLRVDLPAEPGEYEIRYVLSKDRTVLASKPLTIVAAEATVSGPGSAEAGTGIVVEWSGPDNQNDFIALAEAGADDNDYESYKYTKDGSPIRMTVPGQPGEYELRYVLSRGRTVIARAAITVTETTASVSAPSSVVAGAPVVVEWQGPDSQNDYISIARADANDNEYETYAYTKDGSPLRITAPGAPGNYEVRYVLNEDRTVLARTALEITAVDAGFDTLNTTAPGSNFVVSWYGPDYDRDYIALSELGTPDGEYVEYAYTSEGTPLIIKIPEKAGQYELRYIMGSDRSVIARAPVTVE